MLKHVIIALAAGSLAFACGSSNSEDAGTSDAQCTNGTCENGACVPLDGGIAGGGGSGGGGGQGSDGGGGGTGDCAKGTCTGCCDRNDTCWGGTLDTACGSSGGSCQDCTTPDALICQNHTCVKSSGNCGVGSCSGCCVFGGGCVSGFAKTECGNGGLQCIDCSTTNQNCVNGYCQ